MSHTENLEKFHLGLIIDKPELPAKLMQIVAATLDNDTLCQEQSQTLKVQTRYIKFNNKISKEIECEDEAKGSDEIDTAIEVECQKAPILRETTI